MNINSKMYILSFAIVIGLIFSTPGDASKETSMLSSLSKTKSIDNADSFDFFPDYHKEIRNMCEIQKAKRILEAKKVITGELNPEDAEWIGKNITIPYEELNCQYKEG
jgi:hypothetical protein